MNVGSPLVFLTLCRAPSARVVKDRAWDLIEGDRQDGYRCNIKINRGRRWVQWNLPVATLRLERRSFK